MSNGDADAYLIGMVQARGQRDLANQNARFAEDRARRKEKELDEMASAIGGGLMDLGIQVNKWRNYAMSLEERVKRLESEPHEVVDESARLRRELEAATREMENMRLKLLLARAALNGHKGARKMLAEEARACPMRESHHPSVQPGYPDERGEPRDKQTNVCMETHDAYLKENGVMSPETYRI